MTYNGFTKHLLCLFFIISFSIEINGFVSKHENVSSLIRKRRAGKTCDGFRCVTTGKCIKSERRCDGKVDCQDGSDEFSDCKTEIECPGFLFTCDYGACIETNKVCNGKSDCRDNSDETHCLNTHPKDKVSSNCKSNEFECLSGQCIPKDNKCNGIADCIDKSDEIQETCLNMFCPGFTYKCDYGACVDGYAECNGIKDCIDNSDERNCLKTETTVKPVTKPTARPPTVVVPSTSQGCILPAYPENGKWTITGGAVAKPNTKVGISTILMYACDPQYKLSSENKFLACLEEGWTSESFTCLRLCPPLYTTEVTHVSCFNENGAEIKCSEATDGASAIFTCSPYFEPVDKVATKRFCFGGSWNLPAPQCIPVCGEKRVSAEPLIINGQTVQKGNYPWSTAIYQKQGAEFVNVCGGSVLTQKVIITAAHCLTLENSNGSPIDKNIVRVGVGKFYRQFMDPRDTQAQYTSINRILVHPKYKGEVGSFASDIAFLITKDLLLLSKVVQPVCFHNLNNLPLNNRMQGVVTGWGYTEAGGSPSEELKEITIPYKDDATCESELPSDWRDRYFGLDKMCAGHFNKSIAVCKGDSGGGLAFPNRDGRYYIYGLVSIGHKVTEGCDIQLSALFTKVASHLDWVEQVTAQYT